MKKSENLLDNPQFIRIVTFLKNAGLPVSAAWLAMKVGNLPVKEAIEYRNKCRCTHTLGDIEMHARLEEEHEN